MDTHTATISSQLPLPLAPTFLLLNKGFSNSYLLFIDKSVCNILLIISPYGASRRTVFQDRILPLDYADYISYTYIFFPRYLIPILPENVNEA